MEAYHKMSPDGKSDSFEAVELTHEELLPFVIESNTTGPRIVFDSDWVVRDTPIAM